MSGSRQQQQQQQPTTESAALLCSASYEHKNTCMRYLRLLACKFHAQSRRQTERLATHRASPFMKAEVSLFLFFFFLGPPCSPPALRAPRQQVDNEGRVHQAEGAARSQFPRRADRISSSPPFLCVFFVFFFSSCFQPVNGCWRERILRSGAADLERNNSARRLLPRL